MNILMPLAGKGQRFQDAGYSKPKPLIPIDGMPMFQQALACLGFTGNHQIFVIQKEHDYGKAFRKMVRKDSTWLSLVELDSVTEGAACSILAAKNLINNDVPLLIMMSDILFAWDGDAFQSLAQSDVDGIVTVTESDSPGFSYVKASPEGLVTEVAEKVRISSHATSGVYYWKRGSDFVRCAEQMIAKNIRTNGEFYIAPVYNELIEENGKIVSFPIQNFYPVGTPEELRSYLCTAEIFPVDDTK